MPETKEKRYKWRREDYRENTKGLLMVNTGDGKGKTTASIGLMVRAAGRGLKCCMIQFMKSKTDRYGEHESLEKLGIEVHTMGAGFTWDTKDNDLDIATSRETWELCVAKLRSAEYELLVFDEIVYVLDYGFLDLTEVLNEIKSVREKQPHLHIVMSGRNAPQELIDAADLGHRNERDQASFSCGYLCSAGN
jgi:ATP:corrinoid adenosyltransferase